MEEARVALFELTGNSYEIGYHLGSSSMLFGRSEGIYECGLMVGQTSCGLPVGNFVPMRKPALIGLQF